MATKTCGRCGAEFPSYRKTDKWCSETCNKLSYKDRKRGGPPTVKIIRGTIEQRLMARREIDPVMGCWNWTGSTQPGGYGQLMLDHVPARVHRLSAEAFITKRPIPPDVFVCHRCDNPKCFNPDHLFLGSTDDNMKDAVAKGRMSRGDRHHSSKMRSSDVPRIREAAKAGFSSEFLAVAVGVHPRTIRDVISGKTWGHVA